MTRLYRAIDECPGSLVQLSSRYNEQPTAASSTESIINRVHILTYRAYFLECRNRTFETYSCIRRFSTCY